MPVAATGAVGATVPQVLVCHCDPAFATQLRPFSRHASGNFWYVRDKIRTEPHGVAGARLTCLVAGLSGGAGNPDDADAYNGKTHRQSRATSKTQKTQHSLFSPGSVRAVFPR